MDWIREHFPIVLKALKVVVPLLSAYFAARIRRARKGLKWWVERSTIVEGLSLPAAQDPARPATAEPRPMHRTVFFLWNDARTAISAADISPDDPLRVQADAGTVILSARILRQWPSWVGAHADRPSAERTRVLLQFSSLRTDEGFMVEILHTGPSQDGAGMKGRLRRGRPRMYRAQPQDAAGPAKKLQESDPQEPPDRTEEILRRHGGPLDAGEARA